MSYELEIECGTFDWYKVFIEATDRSVFTRATEAHPELLEKTGEKFVEALLKILPPVDVLSLSRKNNKDQLCDGPNGEPAWQKFSPEKGVSRAQWNGGDLQDGNKPFVVEEKHYQDDKLNDACDGTAAVRKFDKTTGHLTAKEHYRAGLRNNAADGEAACQWFNASGELTEKQYYTDDKRNDGPNGEPAAWQKGENGNIQIWHYTDDKRNDLPDGTPAYQEFTSDSKLLMAELRQDDKMNDAPDGTPGKLKFDTVDGSLAGAWRYKDNAETKALRRRARRKVEKTPAVQALRNLRP
jgi:hypothetical protein